MMPPRPGPTDPLPLQTAVQALEAMLGAADIRHFAARELLTMGARNDELRLNTLPPQLILGDIVRTARLADAIRARIGRPITVISGYRSPAYNKAIGGAERSRHLWFQALDLTCRGVRPADLYAAACHIADRDKVKAGIGLYDWGIHIDTGWHDRRW